MANTLLLAVYDDVVMMCDDADNVIDYSVLMTVMTCYVLKVLKPLDVKTKFYNTEVRLFVLFC